jgi:hypothetical protein
VFPAAGASPQGAGILALLSCVCVCVGGWGVGGDGGDWCGFRTRRHPAFDLITVSAVLGISALLLSEGAVSGTVPDVQVPMLST